MCGIQLQYPIHRLPLRLVLLSGKWYVRIAVIHIDGNPQYLVCSYCPIHDGYLRRLPNNTIPKFAHILCSLFSPGSEVNNFTEMRLSSEGLSINYQGSTLYNPLSLSVRQHYQAHRVE